MFAGKQIPDYEINRHTVDCLYAMATQSERRTAAARLAIEDIEQKTEEYVAESEPVSIFNQRAINAFQIFQQID